MIFFFRTQLASRDIDEHYKEMTRTKSDFLFIILVESKKRMLRQTDRSTSLFLCALYTNGVSFPKDGRKAKLWEVGPK
jgi:hypothetical protein